MVNVQSELGDNVPVVRREVPAWHEEAKKLVCREHPETLGFLKVGKSADRAWCYLEQVVFGDMGRWQPFTLCDETQIAKLETLERLGLLTLQRDESASGCMLAILDLSSNAFGVSPFSEPDDPEQAGTAAYNIHDSGPV